MRPAADMIQSRGIFLEGDWRRRTSGGIDSVKSDEADKFAMMLLVLLREHKAIS